MNRINYLVLHIFSLQMLGVAGQQSSYLTDDNASSKYYARLNITECREYSIEPKFWFIKTKELESIYYYDTMGNLSKEINYLDDTTVLYEATYLYNSKQQLVEDEWYWPPHFQWEVPEYNKSIYTYDSLGRLESICDLNKERLNYREYLPDTCKLLLYENNELRAMVNPFCDTIDYFQVVNDTVRKYTRGTLVAEYVKNFCVAYYWKNGLDRYSRDTNGLMLKSTLFDSTNTVERTTDFTYKNNVVKKIVRRDKMGKITGIDKYVYKRRKKGG